MRPAFRHLALLLILVLGGGVGPFGITHAVASYDYDAPSQVVSASRAVAPVAHTSTTLTANLRADALRGERSGAGALWASTSSIPARLAAKAGRGGAHSPIIPKGAMGPYPTRRPGSQYVGGAGGSGVHPSVTGVRFMEATAHHQLRPVYMNAQGQSVHPFTGQTIPPDHPMAHIPEP